MPAVGFDNDNYLREQAEAILERVERSQGKLYLEFGGEYEFDMPVMACSGADHCQMRFTRRADG